MVKPWTVTTLLETDNFDAVALIFGQFACGTNKISYLYAIFRNWFLNQVQDDVVIRKCKQYGRR